MKVLLAQPRWLGDVLLCTPAAHALRAARPDARIDFLTEAAGAAVLQGNPDLDNIIVAGKGPTHAVLRQIHNTHYDAVVDFRSTGSTALAAAASRAAVRIGIRGRGLRNAAYTHLLPRVPVPMYMARQKLLLLEPLGIAVADADTALRIHIDERNRQRAERVWQDVGFAPSDTVVAVSGVSRMAFKQWGTARWAAVADRIAAAGARILLTSGPGEREQAAETASLMTTAAPWDYGDTSVRDLAAIYQRCALWVGNDGGPKHVARAAGTTTLTVIRHGTAAVWCDAADTHDVAIEAAAPGTCPPGCAGCDRGNCYGYVDPDVVVARALELLSASR